MNIDDVDNRPSMDTVLSTAPFYGLEKERAQLVVNEVVAAVGDWRNVARHTKVANADIDLMAGAFSAIH